MYVSVALVQVESTMINISVTEREEAESNMICDDDHSQVSEMMIRLQVEWEEERDPEILHVPGDRGKVDDTVVPSEKLKALGTLQEVEEELRADSKSESLMNLGFLRLSARITKVLEDDKTQIHTQQMQSHTLSQPHQ